MNQETLAILGHESLIAINQDPLGLAARLRRQDSSTQVWAGPLAGGDMVVVLFNAGGTNATITATWSDLGITPAQAAFDATDLWEASSSKKGLVGELGAVVAPHGAAAYRLAKSAAK